MSSWKCLKMKSSGLTKHMHTTEIPNNKKAELDVIAWMNKSPHPMPVFDHDQIVYVLRKTDWQKARVITSSQNGCQLQLVESKEAFNLYDARCIRPA